MPTVVRSRATPLFSFSLIKMPASVAAIRLAERKDTMVQTWGREEEKKFIKQTFSDPEKDTQGTDDLKQPQIPYVLKKVKFCDYVDKQKQQLKNCSNNNTYMLNSDAVFSWGLHTKFEQNFSGFV